MTRTNSLSVATVIRFGKLTLTVLTPLLLSGCMLSGMGGMGMHGGGSMPETSPGSTMRGPATIKESVAGGIRVTVNFPHYAFGDALAYDVSLRDLRDETLIRDASVFLVVTPDGVTKVAPGVSDSGTYVFRPALTAEGAYRLAVVVERIGTTALDPPVKVEHTVHLLKPMQTGSGDGHGPNGSRMTPVIVLGAVVMAVMMAFMFR